MSGGEPVSPAVRRVRAVDRAAGELRAGRGVLITGGDETLLVYAAERLSSYSLDRIHDLAAEQDAGTPMLAITTARAAVLHIPPNEDGIVPLDLAQFETAGAAAELADPAADLDRPMRGPFRRVRRSVDDTLKAAVALCKRARLLPAAAAVPLGKRDEEERAALAETLDVLVCSAGDIARYDADSAEAIELVTSARLPLPGAESARLMAWRPADGGDEHLAIVIGKPDPAAPVLTRLHSECFTGDLLGSLKCDCGQQLQGAIRRIGEEGAGVLIYLAQEGRGIGLVNKLRAYRLQDEGYDTLEANERLGFEDDERLFQAASAILRKMGIGAVRLLTNNPAKVAGLEEFGITVAERVGHAFPPNNHNEFYLATKKRRHGHFIETIPGETPPDSGKNGTKSAKTPRKSRKNRRRKPKE